MSRMTVRRVIRLLAAGSIAACNESTAPDPVELDDVLAEVTTVEAYTTGLASTFGAPSLPSHRIPTGSGCDFVAASQRFVCPPITSSGMTVNRSFQLLDVSETPQSAFDPATTAAVKTVTDLAGIHIVGPGTTDVRHHSEQTVAGLLESTWAIEGEASTRYIHASTTGTDTLLVATITDLTLPRSTTQRIYPSGTISTDLSSSAFPGGVISMTTTFNGTSTVSLVFDFDGVTQNCTWNLDQPSQPPTCQAGTLGVTSR